MRPSSPKPSAIPIHRLQERTADGIEVRRISSVDKADFTHWGAHRDDHYIFIILQSGHAEFVIDFKTFEINCYTVFYIRPGQVHHVVMSLHADGWFLAIDPSLVEEKYRTIFEEFVLDQRPLIPLPEKIKPLNSCAELLLTVFDQQVSSSFHYPVLHALASAYIGMIAEIYEANEPDLNQQGSRPEMITRQFKKNLGVHFKTMKNPSEYASMLCLSLSYLNEVVKAVTGFPVSYWIQQEVILEAKRLLYYSDLSIKEIAFSLGYEDHAYFSRLFSKVTGSSAIEFRKHYRE